MTPSRLFIVLIRVLGVYLVAVQGSLAIMYIAGVMNIAGIPDAEYESMAPFARRQLIGHSLMTAAGLYLLFGGKALLALLPRAWRDDRENAVVLDASAVALVAVRMVGLLLIVWYAQTFVSAFRIPINAEGKVWVLIGVTIPIATGVYLLFGGGWIVRQVDSNAAQVRQIRGDDPPGPVSGP